MNQSTQAAAGPDRERPVPIEVNNKPVKVDGPTATGLQIKQAAIEQSVSIELDFVLAMEGPDGKHVIVGDSDEVKLQYGEKFYATTPDDNA